MKGRFDQKTYQRERARRIRHERWIEAVKQGGRCPMRYGGYECGGRIEARVGELGKTVYVCLSCERVKVLRLCLDCPRSIADQGPLARRCVEHQRLARNASSARWAKSPRGEKKKREAWKRLKKDKARHARRNHYKRLWRKANPDKVAAQKRRYELRYGTQRESSYLEYHRRYNNAPERQESKRHQARAHYYELHPPEPRRCAGPCGRWLDWRPGPGSARAPKHCDDCAPPSTRSRRKKLGISVGTRLRRPRPKAGIPVREARTCLTCPRILRGRAKKCEQCKADEVRLARALAATHAGRGRRTDLTVGAAARRRGAA